MFERLNKLGFKIYGGNGGYMCWVDITAGSGQTALEFQKGLLEIAGVQLGGQQVLRDLQRPRRAVCGHWVRACDTHSLRRVAQRDGLHGAADAAQDGFHRDRRT